MCVQYICVSAVIWLPACPTVCFQVIWQYTEIAYCFTREINGFKRNEPETLKPPPLPPPLPYTGSTFAVLQVAAVLGFCRSWVITKNKNKQTKCTACSQGRIQHCLHSTCNGVEMFITLGNRYSFWLHLMQ